MGVSRRDFLKYLGFSTAAAALGCELVEVLGVEGSAGTAEGAGGRAGSARGDTGRRDGVWRDGGVS